MSTGSLTSERASHPDLYEPDEQWKAELKEKLSVAFKDMLLQAKQKLEADLKSLGDNIDPVERKKLIDEYQASERQIKSFANQSFRVEVEKEREQRRWAAGLEIRTEWRADLENEQMAIMSGIRRQRTGSAGAESNANPKGLDKGSTEPDHLPGSRQQTTTTTPASVAPRPSPIPIPTAQRRSSTSGTPGNSASKNPEVWIPPKSAAEDKPIILGRRTSQASIRSSSSQIFRPSAPIPETQRPPSNAESRSSSSYASKAYAPLPEVPKHATTEHDHSESRTSSPQTSRPPGSTLENQNHPDRDSRSSHSHTFRPTGSIQENNRRSIPEHDDAEGQSSATRPSPPIHDRANAELERVRMDQAEQSWVSYTRAKGKEKEVERVRPPSPSPRVVSVNQDVGRPPTPPMATKPPYNPSLPGLLTMSRPNNIPATLRQASSSSDGHSLYRQPTLDSSSSSSYRQPSVHTSSSSLSRQPSSTFSHNNPNHHPHPPIIPEFPQPPISVDGSSAYHLRHTSVQSPSHSTHTYGPSQNPSHPQRQPITQVSNLHSPGSDQPAWTQWRGDKYYAEHSDGGSESFSEDDETWSSSDRDSFTREGAAQDDVHLQETAHTTEPPLRREPPREDVARREEMSRREEETRKELERRGKEEENRRNELEAIRMAGEAQREAERRAEEARRIQAEAEMKAAMLKAREEALREREQVLEKREREAQEAELKRREEELKRREIEIAKKEAEDLKRRQEESERREAEAIQKAEQERLEARHKAEQERLEEETAKARQKHQIQADKELAERLQREQNESSWKEKERANKIRLEEERKRTEERKKAEERRKAEAEERRKLEEFQATQARARRKEEEAKQQQADFQRREEEIRRKRQDSWTSEDSKARSASGWGSNTSASASSSTRSTSSTGPNPTSGWKQTTPNSNRTPTSPSTPGFKPRTSSSSSYSQHQFPSTPSGTPHTPVSDAEWRRRQEEQARAQQEKFRAEQERLERERQAKEAGRIMSKEEVVRLFQSHETQWQKLTKGEIENVIWDAFPWPMVKKPKDVADINAGAIQAYVLNPHFPNNNGKGDKDKIKEQIRRWHPDRFERLMPRVAEGDRDRVREGAGEVVRGLNDLLTKFNGPAGMFG